MIKKLTQVVFMCFLSFAAIGQCEVTFEVDMNCYPGGTNPAGGVYVNGFWNNWCGACNPLFDDGTSGDAVAGDGIWSVTLTDVPCGYAEFKFTVDGWNDQEFFNGGEACTATSGEFTNRTIMIDAGPQVYSAAWLSCNDDCIEAGDVTLCVCSPPAGDIYVSGTFNDWSGDSNPLTQVGASDLYCTTIPLPAGAFQYKFTANNWGSEEVFAGGEDCTATLNGFTNRVHTVYGNEVLPVYDWNGCESTNPACLVALPMELVSFNVLKHGNNSMLEWSTSSEDSKNLFVIEHSRDAVNFEEIGQVIGNDGRNNNYDFKHYLPSNGVNYYRIKNLDDTENVRYSNVRSLEFATTTKLQITPTVSNSIINIQVDETQINSMLTIYDILGNKVFEKTISDMQFTVNIQSYAIGSYIAITRDGVSQTTKRFVKTN